MQNDNALLLDNQLCFRLYAATRAVTQAYQPLLAPLGLTYPQYLVMLVLWEKDGLSVKEIGDRLLLDSGTLTPLLKRMEGMGLVCRTRSKRDERMITIDLTEKGKAMKADAAEIPLKLFCGTDLSLDQLASLAAGLDQLLDAQRGRGQATQNDPPTP